MKAFFSLIICFLIYCHAGYAQTNSVTGFVKEKNTPLRGVNLVLDNTIISVSDSLGKFTFKNLKDGKHSLKISMTGFVTHEIQFETDGRELILKDFILQEDYLNLEQVVVTATRSEVLRRDAPIICNLADKEMFVATQSVTLAEGLSFQPALRIENNCQNCGFNGLRMNGLEGAYSQILIDGRPIYNSLQGVYGLEQIPSNMIERVEIVRSGGSALYGSSAVAGTVNVITKEPDESGTYLTLNQALVAGKASDRTLMVGSDVINKNENAGISLNAFHRNREFWDSNNDGFSETGALKATSLSLKAYYKPTEFSKITLTGYNIYESRRGGNLFDRPFHETDITEATTHNIISGGLSFEQLSKNKKHQISLYSNLQNLKRDSYYGGNHDANAYGFSEDFSMVGGLQYSGSLGKWASCENKVVLGTEFNTNTLKDNAPSYNRYINQTATQVGFYAQNVFEWKEKFNILLGGRLDNHSLVGKAIFSPRANFLLKANKIWQFRLGYARGFRAPQVFDEDLHITQVGGGGTVVRNAKMLTPEYSNAYSGSIDFNKYFHDFSLGLTVDAFATRLKNVFVLEEIGNQNNGDLLLERRNGDGAWVSGITINPKFVFKDFLSFQGGMTLQKSLYDKPVQWSETAVNTERAFLKTPEIYGFYVFTLNLTDAFSVNFSGVFTGKMTVQHYAGFTSEDKAEKTPPFFENNVKLSYNFEIKEDFSVELSGGIQNFGNSFQKDFDKGALRDSGYVYGPVRPRTFFLGLNCRF